MTGRQFILMPDGSVQTKEGDVVFFSMSRFRSDICEGNCCFICGVSPSVRNFNDEHVIPQWLLREQGLFQKMISLPNGQSYRYDRYKIPCCVRCNALLGEKVERPVSQIVKGGMEAVADHLTKEGPWLFFTWLALLFFKAHLRDRAFRWSLDMRKESFFISDTFDWEELHHVHCIARSFFTQPEVHAKVLGTFLAVPASLIESVEQFDFGAVYLTKSIFFCFRDIAIISILNDSSACLSLEREKSLPKINAPLSSLQIRELAARLGYLNLLIKERPIFHSEFDDNSYRISATLPEFIEVEEWDSKVYGQILYDACQAYLNSLRGPHVREIEDHVLNGRYTFLFDSKGEFIQHR